MFYSRLQQDSYISYLSLIIIELYKKSALKTFQDNDNEVLSKSSSKVNRTIVSLSKNEKSSNLTYMLNIKAI